MLDSYILFWKNYAKFTGKTTRRDYWQTLLVSFIVSFILGLIIGFMGLGDLLINLYTLVLIIPGLSLNVRRLNDLGYRWYYIFINLIPILGQIAFLVIMALPGKTPATPPQNNVPDFNEFEDFSDFE